MRVFDSHKGDTISGLTQGDKGTLGLCVAPQLICNNNDWTPELERPAVSCQSKRLYSSVSFDVSLLLNGEVSILVVIVTMCENK